MLLNAPALSTVALLACVSATLGENAQPTPVRFPSFQSTGKPEPRPDLYLADVNAYKNRPVEPYNDTKEASESLEWFSAQLKKYILDTYFDFVPFEMSAEQHRKDLEDIESMAARPTPSSARLLEQKKFVRHMFEQMQFSAEQLVAHRDPVDTGQYLLNCILELNTRLLAFYTSDGKLDREIEGHMDKIYEFWRNMYCWETEFWGLGVDEDTSRLFEDQKLQAEDAIRDLWMQM